MLGYVKDAASIKHISSHEADGLGSHGGGSVLWGTNSRMQAQRARKFLGWDPTGPSLEQEIPKTVQAEVSGL